MPKEGKKQLVVRENVVGWWKDFSCSIMLEPDDVVIVDSVIYHIEDIHVQRLKPFWPKQEDLSND